MSPRNNNGYGPEKNPIKTVNKPNKPSLLAKSRSNSFV